ncbi:MAG: hypothetical protein K0S23_79 [Fluviicola sp.]|jgi:hypothetical protein|nr:hypothetical protein [Fluviicola sp.]
MNLPRPVRTLNNCFEIKQIMGWLLDYYESRFTIGENESR